MDENIISLLPDEIRSYTDRLGMEIIAKNHNSGDLVYAVGEDYILKISDKPDRLLREKYVNAYLEGKVSASRNVVYMEREGVAFYLKSCVKGESLLEAYINEPYKLAKMLAKAMSIYHSIPTEGCVLKNYDSEGKCFVHGDFCLPNILAKDDEISGFIDTEASGLGDPWVDYAWCIWSYEFNLKTKEYTPVLLKELGIEFNEEKYIKYTAY